MSADSWRICPKCIRDNERLRQSLYGKVPESEYLDFLKSAWPGQRLHGGGATKEEPEETLREDYEVCTDEDGEFFISYSCYCTKCNFSFDFEHKEQLEF